MVMRRRYCQAPAMRLQSTVNVTTMADSHNGDRDYAILDLVDHSIVAAAEPVQILGATKRFHAAGPRRRRQGVYAPAQANSLAFG